MPKQIVKKTLLEYNERLSRKFESNIYLKREDQQIIRSFKIRGPNYFFNHYDYDTLKKGVVTASAGNHAQGIAYVSKMNQINCDIFVPITTPLQKIDKIKYFGQEYCQIHIEGHNFDQSLILAKLFCQEKNKTFIHPFDDELIIEGNREICVEICQDLTPDLIIVPIGGGGLISGILKESKCPVIGVEPINVTSMKQSIENGQITPIISNDTFVDGASVNNVGELTFQICNQYQPIIIPVSNEKICDDMIDMYQYDGIIAEPAGIMSVSALEYIDPKLIKNKNVVCILSGGNNDVSRYPEIISKSMEYKQLRHFFIIKFNQKPGELSNFVQKVTQNNADIIRFEYIKKSNVNSGTVLVGLDIVNTNFKIEHFVNLMNFYNYEFRKVDSNDILYSFLI